MSHWKSLRENLCLQKLRSTCATEKLEIGMTVDHPADTDSVLAYRPLAIQTTAMLSVWQFVERGLCDVWPLVCRVERLLLAVFASCLFALSNHVIYK